jgi:hypothetical protein
MNMLGVIPGHEGKLMAYKDGSLGFGQTPGAYGPLMAYKDGVFGGMGEYFHPLGQNDVENGEAPTEEDKNKELMIYGGIAVGVVVLGVVAYYAMK